MARVGLLQLDFTVGDLDGNCAAILAAAERARSLGADVAITSELGVVGYPPRDLLERPSFVRLALAANLALVERIPEGLWLIFGSIDAHRGQEGRPVHNAAIVARRGQVVARAHKRLLPTYDVFDEDRWFEPGQSGLSVELGGLRVGVTVCEDAWNDDRGMAERAYGGPRHAGARYHANPIAELFASPVDLLVNLSASPFTLPKRTARSEMFAAIAKKYGVPIAFVNQVGGNDELLFDGRSALFASDGAVVARAAAFAEEVLVAGVAEGGSLAPDLASDEQAAYEALVMGTRDYAKKCGFRTAVLGLSGGIDSALTATIAADALGPANVLGVAMPSRYSSEGSRTDALELSRGLGIGLREVSIEPMFDAFATVLDPALSELSAPSAGDVTFENIQARLRGTILMAVSNRTGALLLTTGNKSEVGVGYCTLYGDMAGGLAVISDVPKTMVNRLARYVNRKKIRIPQASIDKAPSAELRPNQTDQDSLPPYELLDRVLELYVEDGLGREAILAEGIAEDVVDRVITLVGGSEYKRRQAAPGLILTKKAFGIGRRMPIAQRFRE
jgi:NAD+ synthase (glutamine-hydrolysing)